MSANIEERKRINFKPGSTVRVWQKIVDEKGKTRLQVFEGMIIAHKHGYEAGGTFTVRKVSDGIGVERIFPIFSPNIDKIEIVKRTKVRRAKLYYVRDKTARQIRKKIKEIKKEGRSSDVVKKQKKAAKKEEREKEAITEETKSE